MKLITDSPALYCTSTPIQPAIDYDYAQHPQSLLQIPSTRTVRKKERKRKKGEKTLRMMNRDDNKSVQVDVKH